MHHAVQLAFDNNIADLERNAAARERLRIVQVISALEGLTTNDIDLVVRIIKAIDPNQPVEVRIVDATTPEGAGERARQGSALTAAPVPSAAAAALNEGASAPATG